ncbi:MAG TPA: alpha-amylase family glycosyl hydrolase, partial [Symbiobacteriaceae bacterium]|nr:alpha-amylase family glycosyl hydrolase [Symbiobacteriaceae bacterium]
MVRRCMALVVAILLLVSLQAGKPALAGQAPPVARSWQDESIYFLMTDRFYDGDPSNNHDVQRSKSRGWHGGDLAGVTAKLDYIHDLGFTAIWITPHVQNAEWDYHGYGAVDFFAVDPHFGSLADVKQLVTEAHARDLRVIFDMVLNHTGPLSPLLKEHPDWFHPAGPITDWNDPVQLQEKWLFNLPDFDQSQPAVREYIL